MPSNPEKPNKVLGKANEPHFEGTAFPSNLLEEISSFQSSAASQEIAQKILIKMGIAFKRFIKHNSFATFIIVSRIIFTDGKMPLRLLMAFFHSIQKAVADQPPHIARKFITTLVGGCIGYILKAALLLGLVWAWSVIFCAPGTHRFRRRCLYAAAANLRKKRQTFHELQCLDETTKSCLSQRIHYLLNSETAFAQWQTSVAQYLSFQLFPLVLLVTTPVFASCWIFPPILDWAWFIIMPLGTMFVSLGFWLFFGIPIVLVIIRNHVRRLWYILLYAALVGNYFLLQSLIQTAHSPRGNTLWAYFVVCFLTGGLGAWGLAFVASLSTEPIYRWWRRYYAGATIVVSLLKIASEIEHATARQWGQSSFSRKLMASLEEIAICLERDWWRGLAASDMKTNEWSRNAASEMAVSIRNLKKWLLTPKPDTITNFRDRIIFNLVAVASGNWDALERTPSDPASRRASWKNWLIARSRTVAVGALITLAIFIMQKFHIYALRPQWIFLGALYVTLCWAIDIDPLTSSRMEVLKSIKESFTEGKEKK